MSSVRLALSLTTSTNDFLCLYRAVFLFLFVYSLLQLLNSDNAGHCCSAVLASLLYSSPCCHSFTAVFCAFFLAYCNAVS